MNTVVRTTLEVALSLLDDALDMMQPGDDKAELQGIYKQLDRYMEPKLEVPTHEQ